MAETTIIPCMGLHTDPNAAVPPPGGMRQAVNVVIDAPGVATARPNFDQLNRFVFFPEERVPYALHQFANRTIVVSRGVDGADGQWFLDHDSGGLLSSDFAPPEITISPTQFAQVRRNLYLTHHAGIQKLTSATSFPEPAGMHAPGQLILGLGVTPLSWFAPNEWTAYRVCFVKVDDNGLETRSPPSSYLTIQNTAASDQSVVLSIPLPPYALAGEKIEIYRSLTVTTPPPADAMFLSMVYEITITDTSQGFALVTDNTHQDQLGQMLYTSAGREGIEGANNPPPHGVALTNWNDSLWVGATRYPAILEIDLTRPWRAPGETTPITANVAINNPVAIVSSATDIRPGQRVNAPGVFPPGTNVLTVVGTNVTMDQDAMITNLSATLSFWDVFTLAGLEYFGATTDDFENRRFRAEDPTAMDVAEAGLRTARNFARAITRGSGGALVASTIELFSTDGSAPRAGRIVIQRTTSDPGAGPIVFNQVSIDAFDPVDRVKGFTGSSENRPNRIAYSKPQEPEHFRLLDWIEMGREDAFVLGFAPLSGGMLVFKQDGIWSVSGTFPTFSVAKVSDSAMVRGGCVDVCEDIAYAWTDRGVLAMTETGLAQNLTDGKIREELRTWLETELYPAADQRRGNAHVVCWDALHQVLITTCDVAVLGNPFRTYCYSTLTGEWSRWDLEMRHPTFDEGTGRLVYGRAVNDAWELRESLPLVRGWDFEWSVATFLANGTQLTFDANDIGGWRPMRGDWLMRADGVSSAIEWRRVMSSLNVGVTWFVEIDEPFSGTGPIASSMAREGALAVLEWQRHGMTPPSNAGFIRELQVHLDVDGFVDLGSFDTMSYTMRVEGGAHSDRSKTRATLVSTPPQRIAASRPIRFGVPRAHARSTHLYPYLEVNEGFRWRCLGIALVGEQQSSRMTRGVT